MEEVIEEPTLDASLCSFHSPNSETVKYYYKLKYPNSYSLPRKKILDLLEDEKVYSELKQSVNSFINRVRRADSEPTVIDLSSPNKVESDDDVTIVYDSRSTYEMSINLKGLCNENVSVSPELVLPSSDFSMYDSVHSINVPGNCSTENTSITDGVFDDTAMCSALEVPYTTGIAFNRMEKPVNKRILGVRRSPFARKSLASLKGNQATSLKKIAKMTSELLV